MAKKIQVQRLQNFCRVFEIPQQLPEECCFSGGHLTAWLMIDWFNPVGNDAPWDNETRCCEIDWGELSDRLQVFVGKKSYIKPGRRYLVLTDFGQSLVVVRDKIKEG